MIKNTVGLEAEYLLRDKNRKLVAPHGYYGTDDFPLLGEFRGEPGESRHETIANFLKKWYEMQQWVKEDEYTIDLKGYTSIEPKVYAEAMRQMGTKVITECKNIYDIDMLTLSSQIVKRGVIEGVVVSTGLHIHFGSGEYISHKVKVDTYAPMRLPLSISIGEDKGMDVTTSLNLWKKTGSAVEREINLSATRITNPVIQHFVKSFDEEILPKYKVSSPKVIAQALKYRHPGFYEIKSHGFEYRSLPFNKKVLDDLWSIVDYAFTLLEEL